MEPNSRLVLENLRGSYALAEPEHMQHPLLRALQRVTGIAAHFFYIGEKKWVSFGASPSTIFYQDRGIYVGGEDVGQLSPILHDYCHAIVAQKEEKLDEFNFDSTTGEELATCFIEFWLGFVSGYYSYEYLCRKMDEYCFLDDTPFVPDVLDEVDQPEWQPEWDSSTPAYKRFYVEHIEKLLIKSRDEAQSYPWAVAVAEALKASSVETLRDRLRDVPGVWKSPR